jgi:Sulfotransferase domain
VRIAIVSAPKTGNHWIKCLLGQAYGLQPLPGRAKPDDMNPRGVGRWIRKGGFPDGTILHQHTRFTPAMADAFDAAPARIVTIVRDPYDVFVSLYHWVQAITDRPRRPTRQRPRDALVGRPIDDPEVLRFLAEEFGGLLDRSAGWFHSGRAVTVRYEDLHADPIGALTAVTVALEVTPPTTLTEAIAACTPDKMRQSSGAWHVRGARVGDGRAELGEAHLEVFRRLHADRVRRLGYEVR